jgi:hypothetical protein
MGTLAKRQRLLIGLGGELIDGRPSAQGEVIGLQVLGRLCRGAFDLRMFQSRNDSYRDARRDFILKGEDVLELSIKATGP